MKVQDLIEVLEQMDPTAIVVLSSDPEGNSYAPVEDYSEGIFDTKESEFYSDDDYFDEADDEDGEEETVKHAGIPAIVFWPAY